MALQHFYSRVPARVSMFNKTDSFDTFACSKGIDLEFYENELAAVCECKPTPDESVLIRDGKLPPLYCHYYCKNGDLAQSCVSFIPSDFTGERSSYLVHTLIMNEDEKESIIGDTDSMILTPEMFETDISGFKIASARSRANAKCPEKEYEPKKAESTEWMHNTYDSATLKRLIYATISAACGKTKSVFIRLPNNDDGAQSLRFLNTLFMIMPYHMRQALPFVTRVSDISKYQGFKLKCITSDLSDIPSSKGATVNFNTGLVVGIKDEDIAANAYVVDFFYSMLHNDAVRREFLLYARNAVQSIPALGTLNLNTIYSLVFLFRCSSGLFAEKTILPTDDKILEFFTVYEKYRKALSDEYRIFSVKCLERYSKGKIQIPKNIYTKVCRIYTQEIPGVKRVIMSVVIDLMHTDAMRDKLFAFIKTNYYREDEQTRAKINKCLCQVFYGGFLQPQILEFFDEHFAQEPMTTQNDIADRLLLAIRTKSIQEKIIYFINKYYDLLSSEIKKKLYNHIIAHIKEGDELAKELVAIVNAHILKEPEDFVVAFNKKLISTVNAEQGRSAHPVLILLSETSGHCSDLIAEKIFSSWTDKKIFAEYIKLMCKGNVGEIVDRICSALSKATKMDSDTVSRFVDGVCTAFGTEPVKTDVFSMIDAQEKINLRLSDVDENIATLFINEFNERVVVPVLKKRLYDVFKYTSRLNSVELVMEYAEKIPQIAEMDQYSTLMTYYNFKNAAKACDIENMLVMCSHLGELTYVKQSIGKYMLADTVAYVKNSGSEASENADADNKSSEILAVAAVKLCASYLQSETLSLGSVYDDIVDELLQDAEISASENSDASVLSKTAAEEAIRIILKICDVISVSDELSQDIKKAIQRSESGIFGIINQYTVKLGKKKALLILKSTLTAQTEFANFCESAVKHVKMPSNSIFAKLFGGRQ